jgi:hypothetical protein
MEYKAMYKCRLCGQVYHTITASEELAQDTMVGLTEEFYGSAPMPVWPTETHYCGGDHAGSMGLADLLGWDAMDLSYLEDKTESGLLED